MSFSRESIGVNEMFSPQLIELIEKNFKETEKIASGRKKELFGIFSECSDIEKLCLKFLYSGLPLSDLTNYDGELFLSHVRHALKVRETMTWGKLIDTDTFLNFVLPIRINNENLEFYAQTMFEQLYPRVKDMDMFNAVLEVNYWCYEKATYASTNARTASPLTMLRNSLGRCGEESTFTTAALRSVGIPTRQCYTPRWTKSDDNHAWVEVFVNGKWHYIGACEPGATLNQGWFEGGASACMITNSRVFSAILPKNCEIVNASAKTMRQKYYEVNSLPIYADTKRIYIHVHDNGKPLSGISVRCEIVNYSELFPLATLTTDDNGNADFLTGYGDLFIHAHDGKRFCYEKIDVRETDRIEINFSAAVSGMSGNIKFDIIPPIGGVKPENRLTVSEERQNYHQQKTAEADKLRKDYQQTFYTDETANDFSAKFGEFAEIISKSLVNSRGNYREIEKFLSSYDDIPLKWKVALIGTLTAKDLGDITADIMATYFEPVMGYQPLFADNEEIFVRYLLNPRVANEMLFAFRQPLKEKIGQPLLNEFSAQPEKIIEYINENVERCDELDYSTLSSSPKNILDIGKASQISRKILAVSICRIAGVPARLSGIDMNIEFYKDGKWNVMGFDVSEIERNCRLILKKAYSETEFQYMRNFTVGILLEGAYHTVHIRQNQGGFEWRDNQAEITVGAGNYRILTSLRQSDGSILANAYHVDIKSGETKTVEIALRKPEIDESSDENHMSIDDIELVNSHDEKIMLSEELAEGKNIVSWLETGREPTEHLFNEMLESAELYNKLSCSVLFIVPDKAAAVNATLKKVISAIPKIKILFDGGNSLTDTLYEKLRVTDRQLPLTIVLDNELNVSYTAAGYNIGIGNSLPHKI